MSTVRPRFSSPDSPDSTGWQSVTERVNVVGGNSGDEGYGQFRRRRDSLPSSLERTSGNFSPISSSLHSKALNGPISGSPPKFAVTPAQFNLFPSTPRSAGNSRKSQNQKMRRQEERLGVRHLTTLRSAAFWELHRSVIENGEGLIRRMRDYEQSRLHKQVRQKTKERKKRGRKSSTLRSRCNARAIVSEASDEDEVVICSEDISKGLSRCPPLATRARSLDSMDVDGQDQDHLGMRGSRSMPYTDYGQVQLCYDEGMPFTGSPIGKEAMEADSESYPDSSSLTSSSSSISLPHSSSMTPVSPTTPSEKTLEELNVAFANGACSITDYSPIWTYQQQFNTDEYNPAYGDLWR